MAAPLVLLVFVLKGDEGPATAAMSRAVRDSVLVDAQIDVREVARFPKDDEALAAARDAHATAVVEVVWKDATHKSVTLHFHAETWSDRQLAFEATDVDADRGRSIGYAVVSMLPETLTRPPPLPPPEPPKPPPEPEPEPPKAEPKEPPRPEDFVPERRLGALEIAGALRVGGNASGYGVALGGRWDATPRLSARLGAALHAGDLGAANASSLFLNVAGGLVYRPILASRARPFELAVRADFLLQRQELQHQTADGATLSASRWEPGTDLALDAMWLFSSNFGLFADVGAEIGFGKTAVFVRGQEVATITPLRAVGDAGIRVLF